MVSLYGFSCVMLRDKKQTNPWPHYSICYFMIWSHCIPNTNLREKIKHFYLSSSIMFHLLKEVLWSCSCGMIKCLYKGENQLLNPDCLRITSIHIFHCMIFILCSLPLQTVMSVSVWCTVPKTYFLRSNPPLYRGQKTKMKILMKYFHKVDWMTEMAWLEETL